MLVDAIRILMVAITSYRSPSTMDVAEETFLTQYSSDVHLRECQHSDLISTSVGKDHQSFVYWFKSYQLTLVLQPQRSIDGFGRQTTAPQILWPQIYFEN